MYLKTIIGSLILCLAIITSGYCQRQPVDSSFKGLWVNTQYDNERKQSPENGILSSITPQYISIDSLGKLTVYVRFEQKALLGYPIKRRQFGNLKQLAFRNYLLINQVRDSINYIAFEYPNNSVSIVFKKIDKKF